MECKAFTVNIRINNRFLLAKLRLEVVIGGIKVTIPKDMEKRSKTLQGTKVSDIYPRKIKGPAPNRMSPLPHFFCEAE